MRRRKNSRAWVFLFHRRQQEGELEEHLVMRSYFLNLCGDVTLTALSSHSCSCFRSPAARAASVGFCAGGASKIFWSSARAW